MKYITYDETGYVIAIYHNPVPEIESDSGKYVEEIPQPEAREGFQPVLVVDIKTGELYYNYFALPTSDGLLSKIAALEQSDTVNKQAITELAEASEADKTAVQFALAELAEMVAGTGGEGANG